MNDETNGVMLISAGRLAAGSVEVAPGKTVAPLPAGVPPPRVALVDWLPQGGGTYKPVARVHERFLKVSKANVKLLGMGVSVNTLHRLMRAGFVRGVQPSPGLWLMDLDSWYAHLRKVEEEPEFWEDGKRLMLYRESI